MYTVKEGRTADVLSQQHVGFLMFAGGTRRGHPYAGYILRRIVRVGQKAGASLPSPGILLRWWGRGRNRRKKKGRETWTI